MTPSRTAAARHVASRATTTLANEMDHAMQSYRLTINDDWFYLSGDYNISALKTALTTAVHSGGGFVDIFSSMRSHISLLVTTHSIVKFETIFTDDLPDVIDALPATAPSFFEDDYWLD